MSAPMTFASGYWIAVSVCLILLPHVGKAQVYQDGLSRSMYLPQAPNKGGWRPIVTSGSMGMSGLTNYGKVLSPHNPPQATPKVMTAPGTTVESKSLKPFIKGFPGDYFGSGISTSIRPLVTRDVNKISTLAQVYKTSYYPTNSLNYNAPINSYKNPFSLGGNNGMNPYKLSPSYSFDNNMYIRHQQPAVNHRPTYNNHQAQMLQGKRQKVNQLQAQILQQIAANQYHQSLQSYHNSLLRPVDVRPAEVNNSVPKAVNQQEAVPKQVHTQNVAPVTYKPPLGSQFQHFGVQDPLSLIPSSILGSFSSFGHASVKARDPNYPGTKYTTSSTTKIPYITNETYESNIDAGYQETLKTTSSSEPSVQSSNVKDEYSNNLVPPPKVQTHYDILNSKNLTPDSLQYFSSPSIQGNFIPSPLDPLSKFQSNFDSQRFPSTKVKNQQNYVYNTNLSTKRPIGTAFFETTVPSATVDTFEPQSTNVVPENLLVQLPPPYTTFNAYSEQNIKLENNNHKDKYQLYSAVNHNSPQNKQKFKEEVQYFPPRGQGYFPTKYTNNFQANTPKPVPHRYEVTETWGTSGEGITQPTLHSWLNPSQSFQQLGNPFGSPKPSSISQPYFPTSVPSKVEISSPSDVTTIYSTIAQKNQNNFNQLESSFSPSKEIKQFSEKPDLSFSSPSPTFSSTANAEDTVTIRVTSEKYDEVTTRPNSRRKPSRYRPQQETTTISNNAEEDFTTRFETFKENAQETENDLQTIDLPTIPPSKFFKRPVASTPSASDSWNEDKLRKRNKNRRRRPSKPSTTTEEQPEEVGTTDLPSRGNKYKTTVLPTEVEDVTKPARQKFRYSYKTRPTKPTTILSESTSSAQPTMLPTVPVTIRTKLHSRVRLTTQSPLDFEDLTESTTVREQKVSASFEQSSIMKIAKDHHFHRNPSKSPPSAIGIFNDPPDHSHKQDEKDTPTSDVSFYTPYENKYSAQKLRDNTPTGSYQNIKTKNLDSSQQSNNLEIQTSPAPTTTDENLTTTIHTSQQTKIDPSTTQKSGSRGTTKAEENITVATESTEQSTGESDVISTTPMTTSSKSNRLKTKSSKYDTNRPRFSVKDYRNRLNQYTSTSSTEKPVETSPRNRFPNRSRFPSFKDPFGDNKLAGSDQATSTEQPRKKFMPKDPRHKGGEENLIEEPIDNNLISSPKTNTTSESNVIAKTISRTRGSLRRDQNRTRTTTTTERPNETDDKHQQKFNFNNSKRPGMPTLRKRVKSSSKVTEAADDIVTVAPTVTFSTDSMVVQDDEKASTEKSTSETAIMKIAKEERKQPTEEIASSMEMDPSQRVADLTLAASKEYNTSGLFKSVSPNTRRVPDYFTIATDDPILPIEAFFPQLNQKKDSS